MTKSYINTLFLSNLVTYEVCTAQVVVSATWFPLPQQIILATLGHAMLQLIRIRKKTPSTPSSPNHLNGLQVFRHDARKNRRRIPGVF